MQESLKRIVLAYLKESSNYVPPMRQDMEQYPFYNEQEQTYTDLTQLDSQHGSNPSERPQSYWDKQFVYPEQETTNPDWAGGNFLSPYTNDIVHEMFRTKNDAETLYDPLMSSPEVHGLNSRSGAAIDRFMGESSGEFIKVSSMDLTEFMKVSEDTLVHKSKKDLWKMFKDPEGNLYIKRLFEGELLKD